MAKVSKNRKPTHFNTVDNLEQSIQGIISVSDAKKQILAQMLKDTVKNFKKDTDKNIDNKNIKVVNELNVSYQKIYDDIFSDINLSEEVGDIFDKNKVDVNDYINADKLLDKKQIYAQIYKKWQESRKNIDTNNGSENDKNDTTQSGESEQSDNNNKNSISSNDIKEESIISQELQNQYFKPDKDVIKQYVSAISNIIKKKYDNAIDKNKNNKSIHRLNNIEKSEKITAKVNSASNKNLIKSNFSENTLLNKLKTCTKIISKQFNTQNKFFISQNNIAKNIPKNSILKNVFANVKEYSNKITNKILKATTAGALKLFFPLFGGGFLKGLMKYLGPVGIVASLLFKGIFKIVGFAFKIAGKLIGAVISGIKTVYSVFKKSVSVVYNGIMKILNTSFVKKLVEFILSPTGMFIFGYICGFIYAHVIKPIIKTKNGIESGYKKITDKLKKWKLTEKISKIKDIVSSIMKKTWKFIKKAKNFVVRKVKSNKMKNFIEHIKKVGGFGVLWSKIKLFFLELKENAIAIKNILVENAAGTVGATIGGAIGMLIPLPFAGPICSLLGGIAGSLIADFFNSVPDIDKDAAKYNKTRSVRMASDRTYNRAAQRKSILKENMQSSDYTEEQKKTMKEESAVLSNFGIQSDEESEFIEKLHEKINDEIKTCDKHKEDNGYEIEKNLEDAAKPKIPSTIDTDKLEINEGKTLNFTDGINPYRYRLDSAVRKFILLTGYRDGHIDYEKFIELYNAVDKKLKIDDKKYKIGNKEAIYDEADLESKYTDASKWWNTATWGDSELMKKHQSEVASINAAKKLIMEQYDLFKNFGPNLTDVQKMELDVAITDWLRTTKHYNSFSEASAKTKRFQELFKKDAELLAAQLPIYAKDIYQESLENKNDESNKQTLEGISQSSTPSADMEKMRQEEITDSNKKFNEAEEELDDEIDEQQKDNQKKKQEIEETKQLSEQLKNECSELTVKTSEKETQNTVIFDGQNDNTFLTAKDI